MVFSFVVKDFGLLCPLLQLALLRVTHPFPREELGNSLTISGLLLGFSFSGRAPSQWGASRQSWGDQETAEAIQMAKGLRWADMVLFLRH